jgi:hypothetical protein
MAAFSEDVLEHEDAVVAYFDNLKESVLEWMKKKAVVTVRSKTIYRKVDAGGGLPADYVSIGSEVTITTRIHSDLIDDFVEKARHPVDKG